MNEVVQYFSSQGLPAIPVMIGYMLVISLIILGFASLYAGITSVVERKIAGRIQSRIGPNYIALKGFLQFLADGLKNLQKEDIIPDQADKPLFRIAPYIVFTGMFLAWVAIPFGPQLIPADINIGIVYIFAVASLNVVGVIMAGWASNNKWSLIGGIRAAAQIVSYEIPSALAALIVIILAGSLSMQDIIKNQGVWPHQWHVTHDPFTAISFFVMFTALLAEGNRTPFDIPEAESELVSGYNTEYSGFRFLLFFFAEWANIYLTGAILTALFLGGWNTPFPMYLPFFGNPIEITGALIFITKTLILSFIIIQLRWTLPRLRVDQLMIVCWKYLIPIAFFNLIGILIWLLVFPKGNLWAALALTFLFGLLIVLFFVRVIRNMIRMKAKPDLNFLP